MADHAKPTIWYPNQRVIRTVATRLVSGIPTGVAIVGILAAQWPAEWLVATAAAGIAIQTALTKIIALPGVNAWLTENTAIGSEPMPK